MTASKAVFQRRLDRALADRQLATALGRALPQLREKRDARMAELDWPGLRADLTERKRRAIDELPTLIERFTREAEAVGTRVYRAADAQEAVRIVAGICRAKNAKLAVKSKSMATEEIHLNEHLEGEGITAVETDLGEWIIQLAGERPSHLIAPAIHKTREDVARLFSKVVGRPVRPDIAELVAVARSELREKFLRADVGITGGNALIAETGTLMLVTNEGNADLATSLPPVHVAVVGIEKIVPTLDDAMAIVKLLARSGTGQKITTYTQLITGPSRSADIEMTIQVGVHGPKELHVVLLDNGRSAMREDPRAREALRCIRCGACSNVCPSYEVVGGHLFGHIYTGAIGLVVSPWHHGIESVAQEQAMCMGCNACDTVCPVSIPLAALITDVRDQAMEKIGIGGAKRIALDQWSTPERMDRLAAWGQALQLPLKHDGLVRLPFGALAREKSLPAFADVPLHYRAGELAKHNPKRPSLRIGLFPSCIVDRFLPDAGYAAGRVLQALGADVHVVEARRCCGLPHLNSGDQRTARAMARAAIQALEQVRAERIVAPSSSCAITVAQDYERILDDGTADGAAWVARARKLAVRIRPFTVVAQELWTELPDAGSPQHGATSELAEAPRGRDPRGSGPSERSDERSDDRGEERRDEPGIEDIEGKVRSKPRGRRLAMKATYHDACQSANVLGLRDEPRGLLREIAGVEVLEMAESSVCCGFGGTFSIEYPEVATRVLERKLSNVAATGADVVITDNPGCLAHLRGAFDARRRPTRVMHLAEVLWEALRP